MAVVGLYKFSLKDALKYGEERLWQESFKENCLCARAIEKAITENFDGRTLAEGCIDPVIQEFGFNRVNYVLSNTLRQNPQGGRFSRDNRAWAKTEFVPKCEMNWTFAVEKHPAVLDGFINLVRKRWQEQGFYGSEHCIGNGMEAIDYEGKVVVISPKFFSARYNTPEFQLFLAECGFGCSPTASGRKIYGKFLKDGESANITRSDVIGVIKDECMPEWAKEKLQELTAPKQEQDSTGPVMIPLT